MEPLRHVLSEPVFVIGWATQAAVALGLLALDLRRRNAALMPLMKLVWALTVLYSGFFGLAVFAASGRRQIPRDTNWRRALRSTAHCYSGCGLGEIIGVLVAAGVFALGNAWIAGITFALAYVMGFALTAGPLIQEGVAVRRALWDALASETASITVMEITAIAVDLAVAGRSTFHHALFWSSLIVSLTAGLIAAYPVNWLLIRFGIKEGMSSPREAGHSPHPAAAGA